MIKKNHELDYKLFAQPPYYLNFIPWDYCIDDLDKS